MNPSHGASMTTLARAAIVALSLLGCNRRETSPAEPSESTTVPTTVPAPDVAPIPVAPIPVAPAAEDAGAPVMPTAPGPNALSPDSSVATGAVEPSTPPPADPMPAPTPTPAPESPAQPQAQPSTAPSAGSGSSNRNTEILNVPGVGPVRVRQQRDTTSVNVGGIRLNLPMQR